MIARLHLTQDRSCDRSHAGCGCTGFFGAFQRAHAFFEHVGGRVGITRIDETRILALEARFGGFGIRIEETLCQEHCF